MFEFMRMCGLPRRPRRIRSDWTARTLRRDWSSSWRIGSEGEWEGEGDIGGAGVDGKDEEVGLEVERQTTSVQLWPIVRAGVPVFVAAVNETHGHGHLAKATAPSGQHARVSIPHI